MPTDFALVPAATRAELGQLAAAAETAGRTAVASPGSWYDVPSRERVSSPRRSCATCGSPGRPKIGRAHV